MTMLYDLKQQGHAIHCLLIDYRQRHVQELVWAKAHANRCGVLYTTIELPDLGGLKKPDWIVPNRNAIFLSLAVNLAIKATADTVTIGCNFDDAADFPDCRMVFIDAMNASVKASGYDVEICAPYITWRKWKIAGLARELGVPSNEVWTCYRGGKEPCGVCPACVKLKAALEPKP